MAPKQTYVTHVIKICVLRRGWISACMKVQYSCPPQERTLPSQREEPGRNSAGSKPTKWSQNKTCVGKQREMEPVSPQWA